MAEINVTPFVDVMLVLLIVFMVAAPLLTSGVPVDLPKTDAKAISEEDSKPIEITVTKDGKIYIGETEYEEDNLLFQLQAMKQNVAGDDDRRVYVRGDASVDYGRMMRVIGSVNGAGFTKVALISEKQ